MGEAKRKRQAEAVALGAVASGAIVPFVSLEDRAASIRSHITAALEALETADSHRIRAGQELIDARRLVEPGKWIEWCVTNIGRSRQDIARLIKIASAADPKAALEQERSTRRDGMRAARNVTHVGYTPAPAVVEVAPAETPPAIETGTPDRIEPNRFKRLVEAYADASKDERGKFQEWAHSAEETKEIEVEVEAAAEWLLSNMPDGVNETLRSVLRPMMSLPIASLVNALGVLDFEPIPLVKGAITPAPMRMAA
jgi:hypothetical protein